LGRGGDDAPFSTFMKIIDADYVNTFGLKIVAGRNLQPCDTTREVLVNQFMLKKLGITNEEALTKEFRIGSGKWNPIVGVVEDFKANSALQEMKPMVLFSKNAYYGTTSIKIRPENMQGTVTQIQQVFERVYPEQVFDGAFVDEGIASFYKEEERFTALSKGFTLLAILISCLGLYGLASLMTVQRTKEIGIRKVLGASIASITGLLAKDFLLLVGIAIVIASPIAWYFMDQWLSDFVYRVPISWWIFGLAGLIAVAVAFLTVSFNSIRAALMNPVKSLRSE
jgi:ABC-type antimicrobial peptide transport system permease subunit